jgi:uncharacterized oxidoreductase
MRTAGNTILVTGGATGIGLALAHAFGEAGNQVIICGRREEKLHEAKAQLPQIETRTCDISSPENRQELCTWTLSHFPNLNILVNNAGIQNRIDVKDNPLALLEGTGEIAINLDAPIQLSALFIAHLMSKQEAAIINITSGLAFAPLALMPVYCATKAALHSFSLSLRHQLSESSVRVYEVVPPIVDTELDRGARGDSEQQRRGIKPEEVAAATLLGLAGDEAEIVIGMANNIRSDPVGMFKRMNAR